MTHRTYPAREPKRGALERAVEAVLRAIGRLLARYPLEILVAALLAFSWVYIYRWLQDRVLATVVLVGALVVVGLLGWPLWRSLLHKADVRRRFRKAVVRAGAADPPPPHSQRAYSPTGPKVAKVERCAIGDIITLDARKTGGLDEIEKKQDAIRVHLNAIEVRVVQDRGYGTVTVVRDDPFLDRQPIPWPSLPYERLSVWEPIPWGLDEFGNEVTVHLLSEGTSSNALLAGATRKGKSRGQAKLLATGALDPECDLWLMDGKDGVELGAWEPVAKRFVGDSGADAVTALQELHDTMRRQNQALRANSQKKITRGQYRPQFLICDEIAAYTDLPEANEIMELLNKIAAMGLAAGLVTSIATQQPAANLHPLFTRLRSNLGTRIAYAMNSREGSVMVLGNDIVSAGYDASRIKSAPGVGYLCPDGSLPTKFRGYYLDEDDEKQIIDRAIQLRTDKEAQDYLAQIPEPIRITTPESDPSPTTPPVEVPPTPTETTPVELLEQTLRAGGAYSKRQLREATGHSELAWWGTLRGWAEDGTVVKYLAKPQDKPSKVNPWLYRWNESTEGEPLDTDTP